MPRLNLGVVLLLAILNLTNAERVSYRDYAVIRCSPETQEQLELLRSLQSNTTQLGGLDFWSQPINRDRAVDIMVGPKQRGALLDWMEQNFISYNVIIEDLDDQIQRTMPPPMIMRQYGNTSYKTDVLSARIYFKQYQRYSVMEEKLKSLEELDSRISLETIGKSFEGRNLYLVKVSNNPQANKPVILIDSGHHAREWISHTTLMYLLESLVNIDIPRWTQRECRVTSCYAALANKTKLDLDNYDYWFVPVINPDGYEYSYTTDRIWRKTRSRDTQSIFSPCYGVDPNRNYDIHWRESGASRYACSDTFAGRKAFSEPETRALANVMDNNGGRIIMYISLHAYSQLILTPYGHRPIYPEDWNDLEKVALAGKTKISQLRNTEYGYGPSSIVLYPAAGGSDDYAYSVAKIKYSYTIELPDRGNYGFVLPSSEIIPVGHEILLGLRGMTDAMYEIEHT